MRPMLISLLLALPGALGLAPTLDEPLLDEPDPAPQEAPPMTPKPKITPFLWFDDDAEAAVAFYTSLFPGSEVLEESRWGPGGPVPEGTLMTCRFLVAGQQVIALNAGPKYRFNEAFSLMVDCVDQAEIDRLWEALTADGGEESQCGWLKDRWGLSWQIVPGELGSLLSGPDPAACERVGAALMQMRKIDLETLRRAHAGE